MIQDIVTKNLCTQCGVCAGVCPNDNIVMEHRIEWYPVVGDNCSGCRKCIESCPGGEVNFPALNRDIFGQETYDMYLGHYGECFLGSSKDKEIKENSSSGGVVTSVCIEMLKHLDGVIVTKDTEDVLYPRAIVAKSAKEVKASMQSKYVTVPVGEALKGLRGKYAVVGLPCHIHGFRKAHSKNIVACIGIFCEYTAQRTYMGLMSRLAGVDMEDVKKIKYRQGERPGGMVFYNGKQVDLPVKPVYYPLTLPYINKRCMKCIDHTNELADISVGDAWGLSDYAVVIVRNKRAKKYLQSCNIRPVSSNNVMKCQKKQLELKKDGFQSRFMLHRPAYHQDLPSSQFFDNYLLKMLIFLRHLGIYQRMPRPFYDWYLRIVLKKAGLLALTCSKKQ